MEDLKNIGKYELHEYLGGGMSHVFKARDPVMNRVVVVKILTQQATADADAKARFLREAQTAGALSHDNVIRVYDYGEEYGRRGRSAPGEGTEMIIRIPRIGRA